MISGAVATLGGERNVIALRFGLSKGAEPLNLRQTARDGHAALEGS